MRPVSRATVAVKFADPMTSKPMDWIIVPLVFQAMQLQIIEVSR